MHQTPLAKTRKEGRYMVRIIGAIVLLLGLIWFFIRDRWLLTPETEATPWYIMLILCIVAILIFAANRVFWNSYLMVYMDKIVFKAYDQEDPITLFYTDILSINGITGNFHDLPGIDLDTSNTLTITTKDKTTTVYNISCSRKSFQNVLPTLITSRQSYHSIT